MVQDRTILETTRLAVRQCFEALHVTPRRSLTEFAEQEIVIPDGRYKGLKFRVDRNPLAGVLLRAIDEAIRTKIYNRINVLGPSQQGKTFIGWVIPILYHLFEIGETVIIGVPSADIWEDKYQSDLLPAIKHSRFKDLLPTAGSGSRGGSAPERIDFKNGAVLRVLTGGGDDKSRSAFTSRVLAVTETDGFGKVAGNSQEADQLKQLEARTKFWDDDSFHYYECTVSVETAKTWQIHKNSTESRLAQVCPHCEEFVTIERENLRGWKDADDEMQAIRQTAIYCPNCDKPWTDEQRSESARTFRLLHRGQTIDRNGEIHGEPPPTKTLSFRFNAAQSMFTKPGTLGGEEWNALRSVDQDNAEKELRQFRWTLPHQSSTEELTKLDQFTIIKRTIACERGNVPDDCEQIFVGIDVGKKLIHWTCLAFRPDGGPHVVDYGALSVPSEFMSIDEAILQTLRTFRDEVLAVGWKQGEELIQPDWTLIDSGYHKDPIHIFVRESGPGFLACKGFGESQDRGGEVKDRGGEVILDSRNGARDYEVVEFPDGRILCEIGADKWKSHLHARISTPMDKPGAFTLFSPGDHLSFIRHLLSETQYEEFDPKKGSIIRWNRKSKQNHWLDSTALADVAGHLGGVRLAHEQLPAEPEPEPAPPTVRRRNVTEIPQRY